MHVSNSNYAIISIEYVLRTLYQIGKRCEGFNARWIGQYDVDERFIRGNE